MDLKAQGHLGLGVYTEFELIEGQVVTFVLRDPPPVDIRRSSSPAPGAQQPAKSLSVEDQDAESKHLSKKL